MCFGLEAESDGWMDGQKDGWMDGLKEEKETNKEDKKRKVWDITGH